MPLQSDEDYFRDRARIERELAANAPTPGVAAVHLELARGYERLVRGEPSAIELSVSENLDRDTEPHSEADA